MPEFTLSVAVVVFVFASGAIMAVGPRMVKVATGIVSRTGMGEAIVGAVFVGAATSLPDTVATITPAITGLADLAVGNALGGVLGQTMFLAVADIAYRRAHLGRAGPSNASLLQGSILIILLGMILVLVEGPDITVLGIHPVTPLLFVAYAFGIRAVAQVSDEPMWVPVGRPETRRGHEEPADDPLDKLWLRFVLLTAVLGFAGWLLVPAAEQIVDATGLTRTAVGTFMTGLSSSLAELVVSVSAVRAGALTLAVGNVFGGNMFDALLVGAADIAYREGSIYASLTSDHSLIAAIAIVLTAVMLLGLLRRERALVAGVGTESIIVIILYGVALAVVTT